MPILSLTRTSLTNGTVHVEPRGAFQIAVPSSVSSKPTNHISFTIRANKVEDITDTINNQPQSPIIPGAGFAEFEGIVVHNSSSETSLEALPTSATEKLSPINNKNVLYAVMADGSEKLISTPTLFSDSEITIDLPVAEYAGIKSLIVRNENTGYSLEVSSFSAYDSGQALGYAPNHAITEAGDCIIKYEGITITRPTNDIDDVVPEITLNVHEKTEKTATITVTPDKEASKNALIEFVGKYNKIVAKINVLSQNKAEIVEELDYLTDDEKENTDVKLPVLNMGDEIEIKSLKHEQHFTQAPARFTEASLVKKLEELGIGRPSTYATIMSTIVDRQYVEQDKQHRFHPTNAGWVLISYLSNYFKDLVDVNFTAKTEDALDDVSNGVRDKLSSLKSFWEPTSKTIDSVRNIKTTDIIDKINEFMNHHLFRENGDICPKCGGKLGIKLSKFGAFIGCSNYPNCKHIEKLDK